MGTKRCADDGVHPRRINCGPASHTCFEKRGKPFAGSLEDRALAISCNSPPIERVQFLPWTRFCVCRSGHRVPRTYRSLAPLASTGGELGPRSRCALSGLLQTIKHLPRNWRARHFGGWRHRRFSTDSRPRRCLFRGRAAVLMLMFVNSASHVQSLR